MEECNKSGTEYEDCIRNNYTKGSIKMMEDSLQSSPEGATKGLQRYKNFVEGAEWKIVKENIDGDRADIVVLFTEHPEAKKKGREIPYVLTREDGEWKIDMEKQIEMALDIMKQIRERAKGNLLPLLKEHSKEKD